MATESWQERTELLLGADKIEQLARVNVLIAGVGGVGGYAAEQLVRAGIGNITIVDHDTVHSSNRNRQIAALTTTVGKYKVDVLKERFLAINPDLNLTVINDFLRDEKTPELVTDKFDYVVDAIDTLSPKVFLLHHCVTNNIKVVSSMGAGAKTDPLQIKISDISKSYNCRLASYIRKYLHRLGVYKGFKVVFSAEKANKEAVLDVDNEQNKKSIVGTISYMPAIFGCYCAYVVIDDLFNSVK